MGREGISFVRWQFCKLAASGSRERRSAPQFYQPRSRPIFLGRELLGKQYAGRSDSEDEDDDEYDDEYETIRRHARTSLTLIQSISPR